MSRSRKKTPAGGVAIADSEQCDKTIASRQIRRRTRQAIWVGEEAPARTGYSDPWKWAKDGKVYYTPAVVRGYPKIMRK